MQKCDCVSRVFFALLAIFFSIGLILFLFASPAFSEMLFDRPIKIAQWRGDEIEYLGGTVIIQIAPEADSIEVDSLLSAYNCSVLGYSGFNGWALVGCDTGASVFAKIDSLTTSPLILWAEPNGIVRPASAPNDPFFTDSSQWNFWNTGKGGIAKDADIDALEAWERETGDSNLIIAVIDCGFPYDICNLVNDTCSSNGRAYQPGDYCHEDLIDENKYILGYNCCDSVAGCIRAEDGAFMADLGGPGFHGTAVTGVISAMTDNHKGVAGLIWDCKIYVIKLWPTEYKQTCYNMSLAVHLAVNYGAKVINISGGTYRYVSEMLEQAIERADSANCIIVAAVGNEWGDAGILFPAGFATHANRDWNCCDPDSCPNYPDSCGHRNVIAVGASTRYDVYANFSNPSTDTTKVTVMAPTDVLTTNCEMPLDSACSWYAGFDGTSISAPHVTGVAGLLQSRAMHKGGSITPDSIRTLIEWTADDLRPEGWDDTCGFGRVNALRALMAMDGYYPNATGYLRTNATWGDTLGDTIYVLGDVVVPAACTLTIDSGAVVRFLANNRENFGSDSTKCEIIVKGKLIVNGTENDSVWLISENDTADWYGIRVDSGGSATLRYCNIEDAYSAIRFYNSSADSVTHCRFHNNYMHGILTKNNSLVVQDCRIEKDWLGIDDSEGFGVFCDNASPTIKNTFFQGLLYGVEVYRPSGKGVYPTPLVEECCFYNIGSSGIYSESSNPTIQKNSFKGTFGEACIEIKGGIPQIKQCYMASQYDSIPIGLLFTNGAQGAIRKTTIWDYSSCAVVILGSITRPNFGNSDSINCNWFEKPDEGEYYFMSESTDSISARRNYWEDNNLDSIQGNIQGLVAIYPVLSNNALCFPYYVDLCSDLPPEDPTYDSSQWKLAYEDNENQKDQEEENKEKIPKNFSLSQNYPNPFNPSTVIKYDLPQSAHVKLTIYNVIGQKVRTIMDEVQDPGYRSILWDGKDDRGKDVASGIYFFGLKAGDFEAVKRMVLLR